jgi:hypothetical protein
MAKSLSSTLPGTWRLVSRIDLDANGERRIDSTLGEDPIALLFYDGSGNFAAQFMKRDRSSVVEVPAGPAHNNSRAQDGYDAYFGSYTIDDTAGTVTQQLAGALSKENVGHVLTREMTVEGDELTIELETTSGEGEAVRRTLRWTRVG